MYPQITLSHITNEAILRNFIYKDRLNHYYLTDDWSSEMYDALAFAGFISVAMTDDNGKAWLLPEMQFGYAVLYWDRLHVARRLKNFITKKVFPGPYWLSINKNTEAVFKGIATYHQSNNWMIPPYLEVLRRMQASPQNYRSNIISVELWDDEKLIGGEVGYIIGGIYTSLTGFFDREHYSNFGKIQLLSLAALLKSAGFAFWNMGHPYMKYKFALGAIEYERLDFLKLWFAHREEKIPANLPQTSIECADLLRICF